MSKRGRLLPFVEVEWRDAFMSAKTAWRQIGEVPEFHALPSVCNSVGFLVKRNKKGLTLAMSVSDEGMVGGLWHVPAGMVRRVRRLKKS